jgi:spermidine synthase
MVPEISQRFFPNMALGFDDPRVQVHITDGIKWVQVGPDATPLRHGDLDQPWNCPLS